MTKSLPYFSSDDGPRKKNNKIDLKVQDIKIQYEEMETLEKVYLKIKDEEHVSNAYLSYLF